MLVVIIPTIIKELPLKTRKRRKPRSYKGPVKMPEPIARKTCMLPIQEMDEGDEDGSL